MLFVPGSSSAITTDSGSEAASGRRLALRLPKLRLPATDESQRQTQEVNKNLEVRITMPSVPCQADVNTRRTAHGCGLRK